MASREYSLRRTIPRLLDISPVPALDPMTVISAPTPELLCTTDLLSAGMTHLLKARQFISQNCVQYESTHDALGLFYLAIRQIGATIELARSDAVFLPAALTGARVALECSARAFWLVDHDDPFERECRWLGMLAEEVESRRRASRYLTKDGQPVTARAEEDQAAAIERHLMGVTGKLPAGYKVQKLPKFGEILSVTRINMTYAIYVLTSQYSHGTTWALSTYRTGLGTRRNFVELKDSRLWKLPLEVCAAVLEDPGRRLLLRLGVPLGRTLPRNYSGRLERAIARLGQLPDAA